MKKVYFLSDSTGITAETFGKSLLANFPENVFEFITKPYLRDVPDTEAILNEINSLDEEPIVFISVMNKDIINLILSSRALHIDLLSDKIRLLEGFLHQKSQNLIGRSTIHTEGYKARIEAINFAMENDDGISYKSYFQADIILIGVSRASKTPTSLYLGMQFGIFAANYPFVEDDFTLNYEFPEVLKPFTTKIFGLNIDPTKLASIRQQRKPDSTYASLKQCIFETEYMEALYKKHNIPSINSTSISIEEISTKAINMMHLKKRI